MYSGSRGGHWRALQQVSHVASYPGSFEGAEKRAWSTLSAHAFNFSLFQESVTFLFMFVLCYAVSGELESNLAL